MKKRLLSLALAMTLIVAMALPVSVLSVSAPHYWGDTYYHTNDTCYPTSYECVIDGAPAEYALHTAVEGFVYVEETGDVEARYYFVGPSAPLYSRHTGSFQRAVSYMYAYHYLNDTRCSQQKVWAT